MYLDYAEDQAERQKPMHMKDWIEKLNAFLQFNEREILENTGEISKSVADALVIQGIKNIIKVELRKNLMIILSGLLKIII